MTWIVTRQQLVLFRSFLFEFSSTKHSKEYYFFTSIKYDKNEKKGRYWKINNY